MKKLITFLLAIILFSCQNTKQTKPIGESPLILDEFDFETKIATLYPDKYKSKDFSYVYEIPSTYHSNFVEKDTIFENEFDVEEMKSILAAEEGIIVQDDPKNAIYPMPINAHGKDEVFVGRIRRDETQANTLNMWIVADNLRKGAATNAVQIVEYLAKNGLI